MNKNETAELNRRDFLKGSSFATLMTMLGGVELITRAPLHAADLATLVPFQLKCAVIGLGNWGREIIATLSRLKTAQLVAVCDTYPASLKRAANSAPNKGRREEKAGADLCVPDPKSRISRVS